MIRKIKIDELDIVMRIWLETNIEAHDFIDNNYWHNNYEMVKEMLPDSTIFVYENDNIIQGFIGLMGSYIAGIFIKATNQSMGIGKDLLDYVKNLNSKLSLQVYKKNVHAVKFYLREKFVVEKEQIDVNTGEIELVLHWTS